MKNSKSRTVTHLIVQLSFTRAYVKILNIKQDHTFKWSCLTATKKVTLNISSGFEILWLIGGYVLKAIALERGFTLELSRKNWGRALLQWIYHSSL